MKDHPEALPLAQLFSTCVECFGLIHPSKEWEPVQRGQIAKLGIQQGRLIAWGDMIGITELASSRDARLDDEEIRAAIEQALQDIIDRPADTNRAAQFEQFGLKPLAKYHTAYQPALDTARLEAFRAKLDMLQKQRWESRRGMSITMNHWVIKNTDKFETFLSMIKQKVDFLIGLMGVEDKVDRALVLDIKALGWHPIFDTGRAAADVSKLRLIKWACEPNYPSYAAATEHALKYLDQQWKENAQETREAQRGSEIPGAAAKVAAKERRASASQKVEASLPAHKSKRPSLFGMFRPKSWRKGSKSNISFPSPEEQDKGRSVSYVAPTDLLTPPLSPEPECSKSASTVPTAKLEAIAKDFAVEKKLPAAVPVEPDKPATDDELLSRVETALSVSEQKNLEPIASMISRHDQWRSPY
ncbi:hypothetical protein E6O75_ATG02947 [Venturia nashicola]|uniref:Prion-inhibition and propagation HeLo domain-containing protein n=1 Tax=Venturia nashicola TaxID=86259 RepID=A0A4Z1PDU0_9PEZI|nr:hypothetical protein E6O75_ATG02947 [Venturia nashicola]